MNLDTLCFGNITAFKIAVSFYQIVFFCATCDAANVN